ncbi:unnamed protein product, partial [Mesorhabditis belari]|uniref:Kinesin-like protein n=1 Tax=Mesorhabditis belari TaxID=2138241 RepID=A0AAF3J9D5_9BILA
MPSSERLRREQPKSREQERRNNQADEQATGIRLQNQHQSTGASMDDEQKMKKGQTPTKNVQVCVRIRPVMDREAKEAIKCAKNDRTITVKGKIYGPFDQVFPETTQQPEVYDKVAKKHVELVLAGYNCTIFAYGQTGTGKTYCMEGGADKAYSGNWKTDPNLGIIPRAMEHIFDTLEAEGVEEYCVRVSYLEIYNEELFDLLAANHEEGERLRLFEDPIKKGSVIISGAEEVPVQTREEVFKVLQRGAERKRMASTLINNRSSRSHCVFVVNIATRETTLEGEELVRQGKLNLVDLAGSESIGRSGASGARAKEAGNINQSLLTLGRCITALTTNAGHVPYRESKLTRLLQDSLGGSTVTTIISTISPSSSSFEETISTLEYSCRAKNIRNHPEINEKLSRKDMLKEMSKAIEKLQRDLRSAREKNGIYVSEESYQGMEEKIREQQQTIEELAGTLEATMQKCNLMFEDMEMMDAQYRSLYERRMIVEDRLKQRVDEVQCTKKELLDSQTLAAALQSSLDVMHEVALKLRSQATELQHTAVDSTMDLEALWEKLDQVVALCNKNYDVSKTLMTTLAGKSTKVQQENELQKSETDSTLQNISKALVDHQNKIDIAETDFVRNMKNVAEQINSDIGQITDMLEGSTGKSTEICEVRRKALDEYKKDLETSVSNLRQELNEFGVQTKQNYEKLSDEQGKLQRKVEQMIADEKTHLETVDMENQQNKETQCLMINTIKEQMDRFAHDLTASLQNQYESNKESKNSRILFADSLMAEVSTNCNFIREETKQSQAVLSDYETKQNEQFALIENSGRNEVDIATKSINEIKDLVENTKSSILETNADLEQQRECVDKETNRVITSVQEIVKETAASMEALCQKQSEQNVGFHKFISDECMDADTLTSDHIAKNLQQITRQGNTPMKRKYEILEECEHVPRKEKLLKEHGYGLATRKSLYMVRDSILTANVAIHSPSSITLSRRVQKESENDENDREVLKTINE